MTRRCNVSHPVTRRRFITVIAAASGLVMAGRVHGAVQPKGVSLMRWSGRAFGADTAIALYGTDDEHASGAVRAATAELVRLEAIFSLHDPGSELARLNARGRLDDPAPELAALLAEALRLAELTGGAFDPTVQPLWRLYAEHFARRPFDTDGPPPDAVAVARTLIDYRRVTLARKSVGFGRSGMALTLNGIAQGYATDRVAELLRGAGFANLLVDIGETRAHGSHPDGQPWRVGLRDPFDPQAIFTAVELNDRAVATSGGYGTPFEASGRFHHLFDPHTGRCANRYASVSVIARCATVADALSTACASLEPSAIARVLAPAGAEQAILRYADGRIERIPA